MKIEVKCTPAGWIVTGGMTMGPFAIKSRAVDLAEGIAHALRSNGELVELVFTHDACAGEDRGLGEGCGEAERGERATAPTPDVAFRPPPQSPFRPLNGCHRPTFPDRP